MTSKSTSTPGSAIMLRERAEAECHGGRAVVLPRPVRATGEVL